jgi:hypothetical protein
VGNQVATGRFFHAVAAGCRQKRYRVLSRQRPLETVGELGAAHRALRRLLARSCSQLVEAAAAEEVAVATLVHVAGWCLQAYGAAQVVGDGVVLVLAPPDGGGRGGGAHATAGGRRDGTKEGAACGVRGAEVAGEAVREWGKTSLLFQMILFSSSGRGKEKATTLILSDARATGTSTARVHPHASRPRTSWMTTNVDVDAGGGEVEENDTDGLAALSDSPLDTSVH